MSKLAALKVAENEGNAFRFDDNDFPLCPHCGVSASDDDITPGLSSIYCNHCHEAFYVVMEIRAFYSTGTDVNEIEG